MNIFKQHRNPEDNTSVWSWEPCEEHPWWTENVLENITWVAEKLGIYIGSVYRKHGGGGTPFRCPAIFWENLQSEDAHVRFEGVYEYTSGCLWQVDVSTEVHDMAKRLEEAQRKANYRIGFKIMIPEDVPNTMKYTFFDILEGTPEFQELPKVPQNLELQVWEVLSEFNQWILGELKKEHDLYVS